MTHSKMIAALVGPTMAAAGATVLLNLSLFPGIVERVLHDPVLVMIAGFVSFVAGLAIVRVHNHWKGGWPVLVTVIGWLCIVSGLVRILLPVQLAEFALRFVLISGVIPAAATIVLVVGAFLSFKAYSRG